MENEELKKARKILEELSQDEHERALAELREKYIMDQKAVHDHGFDQGLEQGLKQGLEQIAKKMKEQNISIEKIISITGLTEEEINNL